MARFGIAIAAITILFGAVAAQKGVEVRRGPTVALLAIDDQRCQAKRHAGLRA